ncbi:MAG: glycerophosphodiester phosphodiesterase [Thermaerobacter sp.]
MFPLRIRCDPRRTPGRLRPLILGHRGLPGDRVENRLESFKACLALGADGVECDVQAAADGVPVVIHDATLQRTTGRPGRVADHPASRLEEWGIPSLARVLEALPAPALLNLEIKDFGARGRGLERRVLDLVRAAGAEDRVLISSFNPLVLARLRRLDPRAYRGQLTAPGWVGAVASAGVGSPHGVHTHLDQVTPARLEAWRRRGLAVVVWGADTVTALEQVLDLDVDAVITDLPAEAVHLRQRRAAAGRPR